MDPELSYHSVSGSRWTFEDKPPRVFAERHLQGRVLNPFAGQTRLRHGGEIITNDIAPDVESDYTLDALEFVQEFDARSVDSIIHDPPWSDYQAQDKYDLAHPENLTELKEEYHRVLKSGGVVIQFGYSSSCMPNRLQYERKQVAVFSPFGLRKDFLGTVDEKAARLSDFDASD